ncbi:MAG TPA: hypothetical protein VHO07_18675 [Streptosporangiaceae bacterium]|jgi:hypothetical protein|nr:hypothetical protein [Streptosporangiaceae bacterium]
MTSSSSAGSSLTLLPVPEVPARGPRPGGGPVAFTAGHHFALSGQAGPAALAEAAAVPLSVILQVTKRCDFGCVFCSETLHMSDPTLAQLDTIRGNLAGVLRVFLSGGEPLLRRDLPEITDMYSGFIIGLPTNATRGLAMAPKLAGKATAEDSPYRSPEEPPLGQSFPEGTVTQVTVNKYERDPRARQACLNHFGYRCCVCDLDFEERYGELGRGFIHVHHLKELSTVGPDYQVDPLGDLRPVCPNCHAMLHKVSPAMSVEELRRKLNARP